MTPVGIQRQRTKGWRMPANTVSVTRPGPYGNPYQVGRDGTAQECVDKFRRAWVEAIERAKRDRTPYMPFGKPVYLGPLIGKNLACWCGLDEPCHRNVLIEVANVLICEPAA